MDIDITRYSKGRITLPAHIVKSMSINDNDLFIVQNDDNTIYLKKVDRKELTKFINKNK